MSKVKTGLLYWLQVFLLPIYFLSFLMPRNKRLWVCGSCFGKRFADNPKYFYLYMRQNYGDQIHCIWISKDKNIVNELNAQGLEAYSRYSIQGIFYCLRAKVYLFDNYSKDISFWLSGGAKKINLWHGIPLKKINMDNKFDKARHPKNLLEKMRYFLRRMSDEKPSHYVVTTSKSLVSIFESAFHTKNVLVTGYPRNDKICFSNLFSHENKNKACNWMKGQKDKGNQIVLYMPTFRDSESLLTKYMDFKAFESFLEKNHISFCIKVHPKSKIQKVLMTMSDSGKYPNIHIIDADDDPYEFLAMTDKLVTDYSSIYFDYLLLDRPIIFFDYDHKEYLENSRELYFDYQEFTPGSKVKTMQELEAALLEKDLYQDERSRIKDIVFDQPEKKGSELLYDQLINIVKMNPKKGY